jgi:hypothetical protein
LLWPFSVVIRVIAGNYKQDQKMGADTCYFVIVYVNYDLTAEDGRVHSSYKQEQKMAAINGTENYAQAYM